MTVEREISLAGRPERGRSGRIQRLIAVLLLGLKLVWRAAPRMLLVTVFLQLVLGLAVIGAAILAGRLGQALLEISNTGARAVTPLAVGFLALSLVVLCASFVNNEYKAVLGEMTELYVNDVVLATAADVELERYDSPRFHDQLNRALENATWRPTQLVQALLGLISSGVTVVGLGVTMLTLSPVLLGITAMSAVPLWWAARKSARLAFAFEVSQTERDRKHGYLTEALASRAAAGEVRVFGIGTELRRQVHEVHSERIKDLRKLVRMRSVLAVSGAAISVGLGGYALLVLSNSIESGAIRGEQAAIAAAAFLVLAERVQTLSSSAGSILECALFLDDLADFARPVEADSEDDQPLLGTIENMELQDVSFRYTATSKPALHQINLSFQKGELVALVGENGSGKSTLARLLSLLYEPGTGSLRVNGVVQEAASRKAMRNRIAMVPQEYLKLMMIARDNISVGDLRASDDSHRIKAAARFAGIDETIGHLPRGYETLLGVEFSGGHELSGGQWQRLAIARAWFRDPDVLILDEPTSALDPGAEVELISRIRELAQDKLVILISHRFGTVSKADRIVVLHDGGVVEQGSHEELMESPGIYASMYSLQAEGFR